MFTYSQSLPIQNDTLRGFPKDAFSRIDDSDDAEFYRRDRFVSHLDSVALATVEDVVDQLILEESPAILDLMASWDSHINENVRPSKVVGLGLNENELSSNKILTDHVIHDLNKDPTLPFEANAFDVVLCTAAVDYMTRPLEVFREVNRVLDPGGLFLVMFSNRFFPPKAVKAWRNASEEERVLLVADYFSETSGFQQPRIFVSRGKPRPADDKYAELGIPSDPIYAVYADKRGGYDLGRRVVAERQKVMHRFGQEEIMQRRNEVGRTMRCPYCDDRLKKWEVPDTPFVEWPSDYQYICFNDRCTYFVGGWSAMASQGNPCSYRFMYDPPTNGCHPIPVLSPKALREWIVADS